MGADTDLKTWRMPQCPFLIEYSSAVLDQIRLEVERGRNLPGGEREIGGVLFGIRESTRTRILACKPGSDWWSPRSTRRLRRSGPPTKPASRHGRAGKDRRATIRMSSRRVPCAFLALGRSGSIRSEERRVEQE